MKKSKRILMMIGFYSLSFTWGFIMSFIGLFVVLGSCLITKTKPKRFGLCAYNIIGEHWGGSNWGFGFISDKRSPKSTYCHEHGHGLQNIIFGPLMPFVVCIPSAVRYGLFDCDTDKDKIKFLSIFCSLFALAFFIPMMIGIFTSCLPVIIVFGILFLYAIILIVWLVFFEAPKHKGRLHPDYDSIWFEGDATRRGTAFMEKYFPEEIYKVSK